ncbi:MAG: hypothetical protein BGO07_01945 [Alphaproteobacteria bacterium 40-19]|nr:MAG: hypothetical protein BGO07_01945 [Alphaproteobacteria bacterium 40-19]
MKNSIILLTFCSIIDNAFAGKYTESSDEEEKAPRTKLIGKIDKTDTHQNLWKFEDFKNGHWIRQKLSLLPEDFLSEEEKSYKNYYNSIENLDQHLRNFLYGVYQKPFLTYKQMITLDPEGLLSKLTNFQKIFTDPNRSYEVALNTAKLINTLKKLTEEIKENDDTYVEDFKKLSLDQGSLLEKNNKRFILHDKGSVWHFEDFGNLPLVRSDMAEDREYLLSSEDKQYQQYYKSINNLDTNLEKFMSAWKGKSFYTTEELKKLVDVKKLLNELTQFAEMLPKPLGTTRVDGAVKQAIYALKKLVQEEEKSNLVEKFQKMSLE